MGNSAYNKPMAIKKFTILHSNDMHGDFLAEVQGASGNLIGGLSLLSGYINQVRREEKNVLFTISGDMLQGSVIDSEYKGVSTIEIMNYLSPDVVTLGNHELDYGLPHLLFLEKMANFPIVNANMYIKTYHKRLMQPLLVRHIDGYNILFIGIITEEVMLSLKQDNQIGTFIGLEDAAKEVGRICDAYKGDDIDLTVLLTHIGFESDKKLASILMPEWGVDLILGGHSHTILDQPVTVNNILIAQAGVGTDQIGRFDISVDGDTNRIVDWKWRLVPIVSGAIQPDAELEKFIDSFRDAVGAKYNTLLCRTAQKLTHPSRVIETSLGNLLADIFAENAGCDVALIGSGSIRQNKMGPVVTLGDVKQVFPYDTSFSRFTITGGQLGRIFAFIMRAENRNGEGECCQVNGGVCAVYDEMAGKLESLTINGKPLDPAAHYTLGLSGYHVQYSKEFINFTNEELSLLEPPRVTATSMQSVMEEYLRSHQNLSRQVEGRLVYRGKQPHPAEVD
jgi:5'-nucleotidase / UDP-sugar diphosphatase